MGYSAPEGHQMIYRGLDVFLNDSVYDGIASDRSGSRLTSHSHLNADSISAWVQSVCVYVCVYMAVCVCVCVCVCVWGWCVCVCV